MGKRGPKPRATAVQEAAGAFVRHPERRNKHEPQPTPGWPACPDFVEADPVAKSCWDSACKTLEQMKILSQADQAVLAVYCSTYSQWRWLSEYVKEGNCREVNDKGTASTSPEAQQVHKYADRLIRLMAELGLTPSARSRIKVGNDTEQDPFTAWLQGSVN